MRLRHRHLVDVARHHAVQTPAKRVFLTLTDAGELHRSLTYAGLDRRARALAVTLAAEVGPGERIVLALPRPFDFIVALYGCLYAGAIAVPVSPDIRHPENRNKVWRIAGLTGAALILSDAECAPGFAAALPEFRVLELARLDAAGAARDWTPPARSGDAAALIQFTSGSTGKPKGVVVSHANLLHNLALMKDGFRQSSDSVFVGWLPLFHDQGLMSNLLLAHYLGGQSVLMSPAAFIGRPCRWLAAISEHGGTTSGGPNFSYDLCVDQISAQEQSTLNLATWRVAFNGAEPVRAATLNRFAARFEANFFRRSALCPAYGMAETTLVVTGNGPDRPPALRLVDEAELRRGRAAPPAAADARVTALVGCGRVLSDQRVAIVDPRSGEARPEGSIGEIWVRGGSVSRGYWRGADLAPAFGPGERGVLNGEAYLRTGDLGFLSRGELFVTGRIKDLIIIRGQNLYPHDIERTVEACHRDIRKGSVAALGIEATESDPESLVVVFERRRRDSLPADPDDLWRCVARAVFDLHGVTPAATIALPPGQLPKTSSGKVRRAACKRAYAQGHYGIHTLRPQAAAGQAKGDDDIADWLAGTIARLTGQATESVSIHEPLNRLGLDSVQLLQLLNAVNRRYAVQLGFDLPLADADAVSIARRIAAAATRAQSAAAGRIERDAAPGADDTASPRQFMLWLQQQKQPNTPLLNLYRCFAVRDADAGRLAAAFEAAIAATPALCRNYALAGERLAVSPHPQPASAVTLRGTFATESELRAHLQDETRQRFDLGNDMPVRVSLSPRPDGAAVTVLVVAHHIAMDLWSMPEFLDRVHAHYVGASSNAAAPAPALPPPDTSAAVAYWRALLQTAVAPTGGVIRPVATGADDGPDAACRIAFSADAALTNDLRACARLVGVTPYMLVLTAYAILLQRYSGDNEIVVGSPVNARGMHAFDADLGYGVDLVPLQIEIGAAQTVFELLQAVRIRVLNAQKFAHGYAHAFSDGAIRPPVIRNVLAFQQLPRDGAALAPLVLGDEAATLRFGTWTIEHRPLPPVAAEHDLTVFICDDGTAIGGHFLANERRYPPDFVADLSRQLCGVLRQLIADPERRSGEIALAAQPLAAPPIADAAAGFEPVGDAIERRARQDPDSVAVIDLTADGDRLAVRTELSYRQLRERAAALAARLRADRGVDPVVAVLMPRCADMVVALLGVLRAGAAYLPLEPDAPATRWAYMAGQAGARTVICPGRLRPQLEKVFDRVVTVGDGDPAPCLEPPAPLRADALAYVMYTSGSSGDPKGVLIDQRAVRNRLDWMRRRFSVGANDSVLQKTRYTFDVSVWEIFLPLLAGGRLVLLPQGREGDPAMIRCAIDQFAVSLVHFVPTMLRAFLNAAGDVRAASLRYCICSGEALTPAISRQFFAALPARVRLFNLYGPTEATVDVTATEVTRDAERITIGTAIDGCSAGVLDAGLNPLPPGAAGELCLAGIQLAQGYAGAPGLTAERFVPGGAPAGARIYRTGDLARWTPAGRIEFLGRCDAQIKINGFRIEPAEINAAALAHRAVAAAETIAAPDGAGHELLATFFVTTDGTGLTERQLREHLATRLPGHLLPHRLVHLPEIPVSPHGKVDRTQLLPALDAPTDRELTPPDGPLEAQVLGAFGAALGGPPLCVTDNFFAHGGDSILSLRVIATLQAQGVATSLHDIFAYPSARALAAQLAGNEAPAEPAAPSVPWTEPAGLPAGVVDAYPMSRILRALVFEKHQGEKYEIYLTSLHIAADYRRDLLLLAIRRCVARHEFLRTRFDLGGYSEPMQLVQETAAVTLVENDLSDRSPPEQDASLSAWFRRERKRPFDFETAPLFRFNVHVRSADSFQFTLSEIALDGWCVATVLTEIFRDYSRLLSGSPPARRAPLRISYRDFVALEQCAIEAPPEQAFWRAELGRLPAARLPRWSAGTGGGTGRDDDETLQARHNVRIGAGVYAALRALAANHGVPLRSVLLAAHIKVLADIYRSEIVVTGLELNGRPEAFDGDRLVGVFNNMVPLRVAVEDAGTWLDLITAVQAAEQRVLPHRRYPYAQHYRDGGRRHPFDAMFVFTHFHLYQDLLDLDNVRCLDAYATDQTFFPLTVHFDHDMLAGQLLLLLDFDPTELSAAQVALYGEYFERVLAAIADSPQHRHGRVTLLDALPALPPPAAIAIDERDLLTRIEAIAARKPDSPALTGTAGTLLTYAELAALSGRVTAQLRRFGVRANDVVAIDLPRTVDTVGIILGTLGAAASYLPIEQNLPAARIRTIANQSNARLLVTDKEVDVAAGGELAVCGAAALTGAAVQPATQSGAVDVADHTVYLIHTSGTTGVPKSVRVGQRGLLNLLAHFIAEFELSAQDGFMLITALNFDLTQKNLFLPLLLGGTLHVFDEQFFDPARIVAEIGARKPTVINCTPSMFSCIVQECAGDYARLHSLRLVFLGGEPLLTAPYATWLDSPDCRAKIVNTYGPAECTDVCTTYTLSDASLRRKVAPIGKAIRNTGIVVLDSSLAPVPAGVEGEICIVGESVGKGYVDADLDRDRFVDHPLFHGSRLYRTGDLGVRLPDGNVDCLGRLDDQVKIGGIRVEPAEIRSALLRDPSVAQAFVTMKSLRGQERLTAYLVAADKQSIDPRRIRQALRRTLPDYMLPRHVVTVDALPLSSSGKIDVRALPDIELQDLPDGRLDELVEQVRSMDPEELRRVASRRSTE